MKKKESDIPGQFTLDDDFSLKRVDIRLKLCEGPSYYSREVMDSPSKAVNVMKDILSQLDREYACVVNLNNKLQPINFNIVSIGGIASAEIPIQNVFKAAVLSNAAATMFFHSHPSGDTTPSEEDKDITRKLIRAGKIMNIPLVDHIIVGCGTGDTFSFRSETGIFSEKLSVCEKTPIYNKNKSVLDKIWNKQKEAEQAPQRHIDRKADKSL